MKQKTILIIDDSATIRRLCDSQLSGAGYHVLMAANAEDGVSMASENMPDLIILDHQLPGTTGYEVACQLLLIPETAKIPVVASSTLRKKAYAEYLDCENVVDMLPKPYSPEALIATVASAIETAKMVVQSQCDGSAVPEVIDAMGESDLAGAFGCFGVREIIDLLNNGLKSGVLEVETDRCRIFVHVDKGRIQAVTASGVDPAKVARLMPAALAELAPVIKFTVAGRRGSEVDGLVELLDNKVLDPRLLRKLLRLQAAVLLRFCFTERLKSFRFDRGRELPSLFRKLPLDSSLLAILVEGALICDEGDLPTGGVETGFTRKAIRGQNLDRAGLSSRHMNLMSFLNEPVSVSQVVKQLGWPREEARRVLHGFELAELVEQTQLTASCKVFALMSDPDFGQRTESLLNGRADLNGKVVKDWLAMRLLLRRNRPDVLLVEIVDGTTLTSLQQLLQDPAHQLSDVRLIGIQNENAEALEFDSAINFASVLTCSWSDQQLLDAIVSPSVAFA